jgi:hypothetical protein
MSQEDLVLSEVRRGESALPGLKVATGISYDQLHLILYRLEFEWRSIVSVENATGFVRYFPVKSEALSKQKDERPSTCWERTIFRFPVNRKGTLRAIVSAVDREKVETVRWTSFKRGDQRVVREAHGHRLLARIISGAARNQKVEFVNDNSLDFRRENLRLISQSQFMKKLAAEGRCGAKLHPSTVFEDRKCEFCGKPFRFRKRPKTKESHGRFCKQVCAVRFTARRRLKVPADRELLYDLYVVQKMTTVEIAVMFGTEHGAVRHRLRDVGIEPRKPGLSRYTICIEDGCSAPVYKIKHKTNGSMYGRRCLEHWKSHRNQLRVDYFADEEVVENKKKRQRAWRTANRQHCNQWARSARQKRKEAQARTVQLER